MLKKWALLTTKKQRQNMSESGDSETKSVWDVPVGDIFPLVVLFYRKGTPQRAGIRYNPFNLS